MQVIKTRLNFISAACVIAMIAATVAIGQSTECRKTHSAGPDMDTMQMIDMIMPGDTTIRDIHTGFWSCPMHSDIHKSEPGYCPICGMKLMYKKSDKHATRMTSVVEGTLK